MSETTDALLEHPQGQQNGAPLHQPAAASIYINPQYLPGGSKSLAGISIRAYGLGIALGISSLLAAELAYFGYDIWRAPFFISILAIFHYLEFDSTARYNPSDAGTSSYLLLSNGIAYSVAHATAMSEVLFRHWLRSDHKPAWLQVPFKIPTLVSEVPSSVPVNIGISLIVLGQLVRSAAMRKAKTNFNHLVQFHKKEDHVLVTDGVYALSRHPAYFGFFWWALGTQLVLGNYFCFLAYAVLLWNFFSHRIMHEERHLVHFFGKAYVDYRQHTSVRIPFMH